MKIIIPEMTVEPQYPPFLTSVPYEKNLGEVVLELVELEEDTAEAYEKALEGRTPLGLSQMNWLLDSKRNLELPDANIDFPGTEATDIGNEKVVPVMIRVSGVWTGTWRTVGKGSPVRRMIAVKA